ncbi:MarR family winged helix-turn-helix transcriptional regulator [Mycobacteroides abscessus]
MSIVLQQAHQVSLPEFEALLWIDRAEGEPLQAIDLIDKLLLTQSGTTRLLGRLEQAGFISRTASMVDGRRKDIVLTEHGQVAIREMRVIHRAHIEELVASKLSDTEMAALTTLLHQLSKT